MIFKDYVVKVPKKGMILNNGNVMIISEKVVDPETNKSHYKRKLIGKILPGSREEMNPNNNYAEMFPEEFAMTRAKARGYIFQEEKPDKTVSEEDLNELDEFDDDDDNNDDNDNSYDDNVIIADEELSGIAATPEQEAEEIKRELNISGMGMRRRTTAEQFFYDNKSAVETGSEKDAASNRMGEGLHTLGSGNTKYPTDYDPSVLEWFENKHRSNDYFVKFNCPEFTAVCPITGQPDFGTIYISYIPDKKMVESKSLKLYLYSFRNHGSFHEDCVNIIMEDLRKLLNPKYIEVLGKFNPRGGISIDPYCNYGRPGTKWETMQNDRLMRHDMYPEKVDNR